MKGAIRHVFLDEAEAKKRVKLDEYFEPVVQKGNCTYPKEPEFVNPQIDNSNDQTSFNI